ncbi:hypothetical protein GGR56DRAFT_678648 [Xylariaceae sp. FL0804]|nr:hypothetical protein GGR56DRAFT_678648 [Xylariaceae sp. FL0804]
MTAALRACPLESNDSIDFVSSYVAIAALWWRALVRAKRLVFGLKHDADTSTPSPSAPPTYASAPSLSLCPPRFIGFSVAIS